MHALSRNVRISLKLATISAYVSIFHFVLKKSVKFGQNRENRDKTKFGAHFPAKHNDYDRIHVVTLHYERKFAKCSNFGPFFATI